MIKKYFKVVLKSDIVLNASLATEGNMTTLDYIPGSNFLGITAKMLYQKLSAEESYDIFHSGKVSFGDAHIAIEEDAMSYKIPLCLFQDKLNNDIGEDPIYLHRTKIPEGVNPKQMRNGFFNKRGSYIEKPSKKFVLKSAQDPITRRSKDEAMYGMESIQKGQVFIFSVLFYDDKYIEKVAEALTGSKRLGKSKSAQYGQVEILPIDRVEDYGSLSLKNGQLILYAESNLCFLNEYGQATLRPTVNDLGLNNGIICWDLSQIRTYSYSPWNGKRNDTSTQRDCIERGSVLVIENAEYDDLPELIGEYTAEGLGRVLWNLGFLSDAQEDGKWNVNLTKVDPLLKNKKIVGKREPSTLLGKYLSGIKSKREREVAMMEEIICFLSKRALTYRNITSSQWGEIRKRAQAVSSWADLNRELFGHDDGFLFKGVGAVKMWDKGKLNKKFKEYLNGTEDSSCESKSKYGLSFVIKLAAEMAKWKQRHDKNKK